MDNVILIAYKELLKAGRINKDTVYSHVTEGRITTDDYRLVLNEECPELSIELLKQKKIAEIKLECQNTIYNGFDSDVKYGVIKHYTLKDYEQANMQALIINIMSGATSVPWRSSDAIVCDTFTAQEFTQLYQQGNVFVINKRYKSDVIELYLTNEELTAEQIQAVSLEMELPQAYQDILVEKLGAAGVPLWG